MAKTTNYNLNKPGYDETADIVALNENADIIDAALTEKVDKEIGKGLVSDEEKAAWDAKETPAGAQAKADAAETAAKAYTDAYVGDKADLLTTDKTTVVAAVNELFTSVSDGKTLIAAAITDKGVPADGSDTFPVLAGKIEDIPAGGEYGTAGPAQVLAPYTIGTEGGIVTGTIPSKAAATITPGTADQTIAAGQYLSGAQTIAGDANLVPNNIVSGKSIFGVSGSFAGKKYASGTILGATTELNFSRPDETTKKMMCITVSGLTFQPNIILIVLDLSSWDIFTSVVYSAYGFGVKIGTNKYKTPKILVTSDGHTSSDGFPEFFLLSGNAYVNSTGFRLPSGPYSLLNNEPLNWYAFE